MVVPSRTGFNTLSASTSRCRSIQTGYSRKQRTAELERERGDVQDLSSQLLQAQDEERRRISRELHDSTGQLLVALTLNLARLKSEQVFPNSEAEALIDDTTSMLEEMSRQLR